MTIKTLKNRLRLFTNAALWLIDLITRKSLFWLGWQIVWLLTFGQIRPSQTNYYKSNVVLLLGLYAWCLLPAGMYILARHFKLAP
jgi:hypothetical protein